MICTRKLNFLCRVPLEWLCWMAEAAATRQSMNVAHALHYSTHNSLWFGRSFWALSCRSYCLWQQCMLFQNGVWCGLCLLYSVFVVTQAFKMKMILLLHCRRDLHPCQNQNESFISNKKQSCVETQCKSFSQPLFTVTQVVEFFLRAHFGYTWHPH